MNAAEERIDHDEKGSATSSESTAASKGVIEYFYWLEEQNAKITNAANNIIEENRRLKRWSKFNLIINIGLTCTLFTLLVILYFLA